MILEFHWPCYERLHKLGVFNSPMLMLGNQRCALDPSRGLETQQQMFERFGVEDYYTTLDLDGGDIRLDLNDDLWQIVFNYATAFNLGTIEHAWDVHTAWCNALRAVINGGHFITCSPVVGWEHHGIHITEAPYIMAFIEQNGFTIIDDWATKEQRGINLWLAAKKERHIENIADFKKPYQQFEGGRKVSDEPVGREAV